MEKWLFHFTLRRQFHPTEQTCRAACLCSFWWVSGSSAPLTTSFKQFFCAILTRLKCTHKTKFKSRGGMPFDNNILCSLRGQASVPSAWIASTSTTLWRRRRPGMKPRSIAGRSTPTWPRCTTWRMWRGSWRIWRDSVTQQRVKAKPGSGCGSKPVAPWRGTGLYRGRSSTTVRHNGKKGSQTIPKILRTVWWIEMANGWTSLVLWNVNSSATTVRYVA